MEEGCCSSKDDADYQKPGSRQIGIQAKRCKSFGRHNRRLRPYHRISPGRLSPEMFFPVEPQGDHLEASSLNPQSSHITENKGCIQSEEDLDPEVDWIAQWYEAIWQANPCT